MKISAALPLASPLPTAAPLVDLVRHKLEARQGIDGSTCGYYDANPSKSIEYFLALLTVN